MARAADRRSTEERMDHIEFQDKPEGPIAAAVIAGGIGAAALGVFTTLAEASTGVKNWLQWSDAVGPLSGKVVVALMVWLVAWAILHVALRRRL
jgi:acyl CoA:acetate/3-ketoacid CoA transferase alpha subunit